MWRFIVMTFAFLGWSFYTISGGADYQPREGSRQAVAAQKRTQQDRAQEAIIQAAQSTRPAGDSVTRAAAETANTQADHILLASADGRFDMVTRGAADMADLGQRLAGNDKTLANGLQPMTAIDHRIENISLAAPAAFEQAAGYAMASTAPAAPELRDLRRITGNSVNMRAGPGTKFGVLQRMSRNTEVEVLETMDTGWTRLRVIESNRVGWVSSKLVSDPADRG
jgi:hypothetical protein